MERNRNFAYPVAVVNQQQLQQIQQPHISTTNQITVMPQQTHSSNHRLKSHVALAQVDPQSPQATQAEYFDISRNQPSTSTKLTESISGDVKDLAYKLNMKRGSVERWLREKYNRAHPHDRIVHPRGFKFNEEQRRRLAEFFEQDRYPKPHDMEIIAYEINCKKEQVKNWFHDRRRKHKKAEQLANSRNAPKKSKFSAQKRKKLEEFFEKNFHPYPGDSRRLVSEFESREGHSGGRTSNNGNSRYQNNASVRYEYGNLNSNTKTSTQTRGFKFSEDQRRRLKDAFTKNKYPNPFEMEKLAQTMGVKKVQVKNWFHDHRRKLKKEQEMGP